MVSAWEAGGEPDSTDRSVGELLSDLSDELRRLAHAEVRLALVQTRRKARRAVVGVGALVAAGILGLGGFGVLIASAVLGLAHVLPAWLAALLVGAGLFLLAGMIALFGRMALRRAVPPTPQWAIDSVRDDVETIRKGMRR
jgi:hypothetical protein